MNSKVSYRFESKQVVEDDATASSVPTPTVIQPGVIPFSRWSCQNKETLDLITHHIMQHILDMHSEKYIIKIKNYDALKKDVDTWVYKSSANTKILY